MALSHEDKKDVKTHLGKALANKVSKVTNDSRMKAAKKYFYDEGVKKVGKEKTIETMKKSFGSLETRRGMGKDRFSKKYGATFGDLKKPSKQTSSSVKSYLANDKKSAPKDNHSGPHALGKAIVSMGIRKSKEG